MAATLAFSPTRYPEPSPPLTWRHHSWAWLRTHHGIKAMIRCPADHECSLVTHTIADDGTVTPSAVCPVKGCTFHEYVRLVDWPQAPPPPDADEGPP